MLFIVGVK